MSAGRMVWRFAEALNRLPWTCWADLVTWALDLTHWRKPDHPSDAWRRLLPRSARDLAEKVGRDATASCRRDALAVGSCYCAKFQSADFQRDVVAVGNCKPGILVEPEVKP